MNEDFTKKAFLYLFFVTKRSENNRFAKILTYKLSCNSIIDIKKELFIQSLLINVHDFFSPFIDIVAVREPGKTEQYLLRYLQLCDSSA
jgi:hypothetical protein